MPFLGANLVQAALFALAHDQVASYPAYFLLGFVAGILRRRSGGMAAPIVLHAANNLLAALVMIRHLG